MGEQKVNQTKKILGILLIVLFVATLTAPAISADGPHHSNNGLQLFYTERAAQPHCPSDTVVWLNLPSGIYHFKGHHLYGNTKNGAYVCKQEADQAGDLAAYNEHQYRWHYHHNHHLWHHNRPYAQLLPWPVRPTPTVTGYGAHTSNNEYGAVNGNNDKNCKN